MRTASVIAANRGALSRGMHEDAIVGGLYSVPASLVGRQVRVLLGASQLQVFDGHRQVAVHQRSNRKASTTLVLDHYLEVLRRKPSVLPGATALSQAQRAGTSPPSTRRSGRPRAGQR
jgi:hypothetical protein